MWVLTYLLRWPSRFSARFLFYRSAVIRRHLAIYSLTSRWWKCAQSETSPSRFDPEGKQSPHHSVFILGHINRILCSLINLKFNMKVYNIPIFFCACVYFTTSTSTHRWSPSLSAAAYSPLCHFRVISVRCRNVQISSFGLQHIRQDYPQARCGLSPCWFVSPATAHQADRSAAHLTPEAFPGFSSLSHPQKKAVSQKNVFSQKSTQRTV